MSCLLASAFARRGREHWARERMEGGNEIIGAFFVVHTEVGHEMKSEHTQLFFVQEETRGGT